LTQVGSPAEDNGEQLGIHGRLSSPGATVSWGAGGNTVSVACGGRHAA
jgi:hypothetical protein